jgi:cysteinyl-tRNA synthetase
VDDFLAQYSEPDLVPDLQNEGCQSIKSDFMAAMDDDFNLPRALVAWVGAFQKINEVLDTKVAKAKKRLPELLAVRELIRELGDVVGLCQENPVDFFDSVHRRFFEKSGLSEEKLQSMLEERAVCRSERDFAAADQIRNDLDALGIAVQDTPDGQRYELNDIGLEKIIL